MAANVTHFAINAADVERSRRFYESVFGWRFAAWGPPGFYQITTGTDGDPGIRGALQERRELIAGVRTTGFECTLAVEDVDAVAKAVEAADGTILMPKTTLAGVGNLILFADPDGNVAGAMQYDPTVE